MQQMESMGLPTGFSFSQTQPERQRKGDKKTFYCEICLIELNSLDTMKSHVAGVKHMKKKLQLDERKKEQLRWGDPWFDYSQLVTVDLQERRDFRESVSGRSRGYSYPEPSQH